MQVYRLSMPGPDGNGKISMTAHALGGERKKRTRCME